MTAPSTDRLRHDATTGAMWSLLQSWGGRLVSAAVFVVLARELLPEAFGVVALASIFIDLGQRVISRGFGAAIVQLEELTDDDLDSAFWFSLGCGALLTTVSWLTADVLADLFNSPDLAPVLRVLSFNWLLGAASSVPQSLLQRDLQFRSLAVRRMLAVVVSGAIGVVLAVAGAGVWSLVAMTLSLSAVGVVVLWTVCPWRPRWRLSMDSFRRTRGFSTSIVGTDIIRFVGQRGEGFLIAAALGAVPLGLYAVASRFLQLLNEIFTSTIGSVAFPVFSRLQSDPDRRDRALLSVIRMTALAAFPAFAGLAVLAPEIIPTMLGPQWTASVVLVQLLALQGLRFAVTYFVSSVVIATGNSGLEFRMTLVGIVIKVVALVIGIGWGVRGIACAVVIASYATLPLTFWSLRLTTGVTARRYLAEVAAPGVAAAVMVIAIIAVRFVTTGQSDIVTIVAAVPIGAAVYLAVLAGTAPATIREARQNVSEMLARRQRPARTEPVAQP